MTALAAVDLGAFEQGLIRAFDHGVVAPLALLAAAAVGALHGLAPGHGKTLAAAYLVGSDAGRRQALQLALIVAGMHTVSVLALAVMWWATVREGVMAVEATTRWAQLVAALLVLTIGMGMLRQRWRSRGSADPHQHTHAPAPPWSRSGLIGIASVGGLLPSPSAFLVLVSGLLTGRAGLALGMVVGFGAGLAVTVLGVGLLSLGGRDWIRRRSISVPPLARALQRLPVLSAVGILAGGVVLCVIAVTGLLGVR